MSYSGSTPPRGIRVICRFRPQNKIEDSKGGMCCVEFTSATSLRVKEHAFAFDRVFDGSATQSDIYREVQPAVQDLLDGYNATIFAYGQTSSGKTHTMQGPDIDNPELRGVIPRVIDDIFGRVAAAPENLEFTIRASYLEIYLEKIRDLLDPARDNLQVREDRTKGIYVQGQKEVCVGSQAEVYEVLHVGQHNRAVSATGMNHQSSRSHSVFLLSVTSKNTRDNSTRAGKLYLVDLAGSEKVGKTGASGTTLEEAKMINKSLSALGNVIKALTSGKAGKDQYVPYRDSKLTRLLQESLGGNARTTLIINCSPSSYNEEETLSTLRFGNRAKTIINRATANVERSAAELKALLAKAEAEIARLKGIIAALSNGADPATLITASSSSSSSSSAASAAGGDATTSGAAPAPSGGEHDGAASAKMLEMANRLEELEKQVEALTDEKMQALDSQEALRDTLEQKTLELEKTAARCAQSEDERRRADEELLNAQTQLDETQHELTVAKTHVEELVLQVDLLNRELAASKDALCALQLKQEEQDMRQTMTMLDLTESTLVTPALTPSMPLSPSTEAPLSPVPSVSEPEPAPVQSASSVVAPPDWDSSSALTSLQQGFARIRQLDDDLFGSAATEPSAEKVMSAIDEIIQLTGRLSLSPCRTPAPSDLKSTPVPPEPTPQEQQPEVEMKEEEKQQTDAVVEEKEKEVKEEKKEEKKEEEQEEQPEAIVEEKKEEEKEEEKKEEQPETVVVEEEEKKEEEEQKKEEQPQQETVVVVVEEEKKEEEKQEETKKPLSVEESDKVEDEKKEEVPLVIVEAVSAVVIEEEKKEEYEEKAFEAVPHPDVAEDADAVTVRTAYSAQLERANQEIAAAEATRARLRKEIEEMSEMKARMRAEIASYKKEAEEKLGNLARLRSELEDDIANRCSRVIDLQLQLEDILDKYDSARKARPLVAERQLKKQILGQQRELQKASRMMTALSGERNKLYGELKMRDKQLELRKDFERKQENEIADLRRQLRDAQRQATLEAARAASAAKHVPIAYGAQPAVSAAAAAAAPAQPAAMGQTVRGKMTLPPNLGSPRVTRVIRGGGGSTGTTTLH